MPSSAARIASRIALVAAALTASVFGPLGCSSAEAEAETTSADAVTVDGADKFVVSATPEKVVILKRAGGKTFPFDGDGLQGKVLVVHPIAKRAETGVVARAESVEDRDDRWVVTTTPLTLSEMEDVSEDDVVRVYVSAKKVSSGSKLGTRSASDLLVPGRIAPQGLGGFVFDGFDLSTGADLGDPKHVQAGVSFSHKILKSDFSPEALVAWSREDGLELGFRGAFDWQSQLVLSGRVSGELFRSKTVESPSVYVTVPIGFIPVPVGLSANATIVCNASLAGPMDVTVDISASAKVGGSFRVKPSTSTSPEDWVSAGQWEPTADGTASASLGADPKIGGNVGCSLPRVELKATVAGVAGPYLAISPTVTLGTDGAVFEGKVAAGVGAGMFGFGSGVEVNLYSWKP